MSSEEEKAAPGRAAEEITSSSNHNTRNDVDVFAAWIALGAHAKKRRMRRYPNRGKGGRR